MITAAPTAERIAELNDVFRKSIENGTRFTQTCGITSMSRHDQFAIQRRVVEFEDFTDGDNPYGERDFGAFDYRGNRILWKIDYYAPSMEGGSDDPSDPTKTARVLTIMLAEEY